MPFTLAHPAAVLPLRRLRFLQTVPLVIGSVVPDVPYYFPDRIGKLFYDTHTLAGSFVPCLPIGAALLVFLLVMREPLTVLLSPRARWVVLNALERFSSRPYRWAIAVPSLLIGSWTHIAWDSFTHAGGWTTNRVDALTAPISLFGWDTVLNHVLQYVSSVLGLAVVLWWLWRLELRAPADANGALVAPVARRLLLLGVCLAAVAIGGSQGWKDWDGVQLYHLGYLLLTRMTAWFSALYLGVGLLVMLSRRTAAELASRA